MVLSLGQDAQIVYQRFAGSFPFQPRDHCRLDVARAGGEGRHDRALVPRPGERGRDDQLTQLTFVGFDLQMFLLDVFHRTAIARYGVVAASERLRLWCLVSMPIVVALRALRVGVFLVIGTAGTFLAG